MENENNIIKKTRGQPLADHARLSHPGVDLEARDFLMQVTGQYRGALLRLILEGIQDERMVKRQKKDSSKVDVLNSKIYFNQARPIRLVTSDTIFT